MKETQDWHFWLFYVAFFCILCVGHLLIYYTFFYKLEPSKQRYAFYFVLYLFLCNILFTALHHNFHLPYILDLWLSLMLGVSFLLFAAAIFFYLFMSPLYLFGSRSQYHDFAPLVRYFCLFLAGIGVVYGFYNGFCRQPKLKNLSLAIPNLTQELKIAQISDLHISTLSQARDISKVVQITNSTQPDIIVLTGDIIDAKTDFIDEKISLLKDLKAKYGIYFVLGNHEYLYDTATILEKLKNNNITILNNTSVTLMEEQKPLINIIGITDFIGQKLGFLEPNIKQAILRGAPNTPNLLLSHQPKVVKYLAGESIDLVLSGHTHGGQIFPFNLLVPLEQPYVKGLHEFKPQSFIYVNQGSGNWGPPMRLGSHAEITLLVLKPTPSQSK